MQLPQEKRFTVKIRIEHDSPQPAAESLAHMTGLSKSKVKDAMNKGAVWLKRNGTRKRLRRATSPLAKGDSIEFNYDEKLLSLIPPEPRLISDQKHYSVWWKPSGLMAQGSPYGDHCSLERLVALFFTPSREVFIVHRLDREASGLMLIAHSKDAAAKLSRLFQTNQIEKRYRIEVLGDLREHGNQGTIELPLDGKSAVTEYKVIAYDAERNTSEVDVVIKTGRFHQIRRHFDMFGHPVMGDPKYGKGNKNKEGMKLSAISLRFKCPFVKKEAEYRGKTGS